MVHAPLALLDTVESCANATDAPEIGAPVTASIAVPASVQVLDAGGCGVTTTGGAVGLDGVAPPQPAARATTTTIKYDRFLISSNPSR
jgi:hypothetical protein